VFIQYSYDYGSAYVFQMSSDLPFEYSIHCMLFRVHVCSQCYGENVCGV